MQQQAEALGAISEDAPAVNQRAAGAGRCVKTIERRAHSDTRS